MLFFNIVLLLLFVALVLYGIGVYNRLVALRVETDNAWSDIDVQLKRRHDLIPNVVRRSRGTLRTSGRRWSR